VWVEGTSKPIYHEEHGLGFLPVVSQITEGVSFFDSPEKQRLPAILAESPPDAILTGFEAPNAGFERQQLGGLETPFSDYALAQAYERSPSHSILVARTHAVDQVVTR
jgi:hypothetical protein